MKWTVEAERYLAILAIQQNPSIKYDVQTIINNWPTTEKPTYRAVQERINVLKKRNLTQEAVGHAGGSTATPASTTTQLSADTGNPITQAEGWNSEGFMKRLGKGRGTTLKSRKRKREKEDEEDDDDVDEDEMEDQEVEEQTPSRLGSMAAK